MMVTTNRTKSFISVLINTLLGVLRLDTIGVLCPTTADSRSAEAALGANGSAGGVDAHARRSASCQSQVYG